MKEEKQINLWEAAMMIPSGVLISDQYVIKLIEDYYNESMNYIRSENQILSEISSRRREVRQLYANSEGWVLIFESTRMDSYFIPGYKIDHLIRDDKINRIINE